jgi:PhzF family phenazine biosynthesis protein
MLLFDQVDVFTSELLAGAPLAVVHDADVLSDEEMAAFARWVDLSETTFLLAPTDPSADYRVRIFTPSRELAFAGHPTLGSARAWLSRGGLPQGPDFLVQECGAGLIRMRQNRGRIAFAAPPLQHTGPIAPEDLIDIARTLRIPVTTIADGQWVDNGPGWLVILLPSAAQVLQLNPDLTLLNRFKIGVIGPYPAGSPAAFEVRAFTTETGREDPVTGSLNAGIAQWLIGTGAAPPHYVASQGTRLRRSGRVYIDQMDGEIWVGGHTAIGISGTAYLPTSYEPN